MIFLFSTQSIGIGFSRYLSSGGEVSSSPLVGEEEQRRAHREEINKKGTETLHAQDLQRSQVYHRKKDFRTGKGLMEKNQNRPFNLLL